MSVSNNTVNSCNKGIATHSLMRVTAFTFMVPYLLLIASSGDFALYRATQIIWLALALAAYVKFWQFRAPHSRIFFVLTLFLFIAFFVSAINSMNGVLGQEIALIKIITLLVYFLFFDSFRNMGVDYFFRSNVFVSASIIFISFIHLTFFETVVYGRHIYFQMHPNLGGEIIFGSLIMLAFSRSRALFLVGFLTSIYMLELLQARSALVACVVFGVLTTVMKYKLHDRIIQTLSTTYIVFLVLIPLILLILYSVGVTPSDIINYVLNDVLLLNDRFRGLDTGVSGRAETWAVAMRLFAESPFVGVGLDAATVNSEGLKVHSGPILFIAEFGIMSSLLFGVCIFGAMRQLKKDPRVFVALLGCFVIFLFQARGLNTNIFPLVMWILLLPWALPSQTSRN